MRTERMSGKERTLASLRHREPDRVPLNIWMFRTDVRAAVKRTLEAGMPGGGYIVCTAHNIQVDVPLENVVALVEAYREYGWY